MQKIQLGNILLQCSRNPQSLAYEIKYKVFWNILQVACNNYTKVFKCRSWVGTPTLSRLFLFLVICLICVWSVYFFLVTFPALYKFNRDMFQELGPWILNGLLSCLFVRLLRGSRVAWWQPLPSAAAGKPSLAANLKETHCSPPTSLLPLSKIHQTSSVPTDTLVVGKYIQVLQKYIHRYMDRHISGFVWTESKSTWNKSVPANHTFLKCWTTRGKTPDSSATV